MPSPAARQRRLQHRADARRAILEAAEGLLAEAGLDGFSMRRLGDRSGFTAPTLYHYFRDKTALLETLLEERLRELAAELRAVPRSGDTAGWVCALAGAFARFGLRHPGHYQLLAMRAADEVLEPPAAREVEAIFGEPLDDLVATGRLVSRERERLRQGLWSFVHGFIVLQTTHPEEPWEPDLLEASLDAMIRGSLARRPASGGAR